MMAMTTNSSMSVKPNDLRLRTMVPPFKKNGRQTNERTERVYCSFWLYASNKTRVLQVLAGLLFSLAGRTYKRIAWRNWQAIARNLHVFNILGRLVNL